MSTPSTPSRPAGTGPARVVGLVARREITTRLRSRAYLLTTLIMALLIVVSVVITSLVGGSSSTTSIAVLSSQQAQLGPALRAGSTDPLRLRPVADAAAGTAAVRRKDADAFVSADASGLRVVVADDVGDALSARVATAARTLALDQQISALGGDPAVVGSAVAHARVAVRSLDPQPKPDVERLFLGFVTAVLIFIALQTAGQSVAMGVVEEKSSRVVEILLATVKPWQLMTGKILGLGVLGLAQVLLIALAGLLSGLATGTLHLPGSTAASMVVWLVVWFALGYTAFAVVFAALGALVSRTEEIGGATAPVLLVVIGGYAVGVSVLPSDPHNHLVAILSVLPPFAPTLMPVRLAIGGVPAWQVVLALVLIVATIPVLVVVAARIYRNAVVRSGAKVRLLDALRGT